MQIIRQPGVRFAALFMVFCVVLTRQDPTGSEALVVGVLGGIGIGIHLIRKRSNSLFLASCAAFIASGCFFWSEARLDSTSLFASKIGEQGRDALLRGTLIKGPFLTTSGFRYLISVEALDDIRPEAATLHLHVDKHQGLLPGDSIEVFVEVARIKLPDFPNQPDYRRRSERQGIAGSARAREPPTRLALGSFSPVRQISEVRRELEAWLLTVLKPRQAGFALALATGNKSHLSDDDRMAFGDTGTSHVLAISGLHFGVVAWVLWLIGQLTVRRIPWLLRRIGDRQCAALFVILTLLAYLVFVGAPVSAMRAWTAASFLVAATLLHRRFCSVHALSYAALLIVMMDPWNIRDIGFHLSFSASAGIIAFLRTMPASLLPPLIGAETRAQRRIRTFKQFLGVSTAASLATVPALIAGFGSFSIAGFWTNLLVVPLVSSLLFPVFFAGIITSSVSTDLGAWLVQASTWGFSYLGDFMLEVALLPGCVWVCGVPPPWTWIPALAGVALCVTYEGNKVRALVGLLCLVPAMLGVSLKDVGGTYIDFVPVGQGDSTLVISDAQATLVDAGGSTQGRDPGLFVVVPYLRRQGVSSLDTLVVTHADLDHVGGIEAVLRWTKVKCLVLPAEPSPILTKLDTFAKSRGVRVEHPTSRYQLGRISGVPPPNHLSRNDRSHIHHLPEFALLTGDLEARGEQWWTQTEVASHFPLLKLGHHGSNSSSSPRFLDRVQPSVAIWSAGLRNRFGHPSQSVIQRLETRNIQVFGTASHGLVRVKMTPERRLIVRSTRSP